MKRLAISLAVATALLAGPASSAANLKTAIFAGGCFWSMEHALEDVKGVSDVVSGYSGGPGRNPTYKNHAGQLEAVKVTYDPAKISYPALVETFFRHIDPTDPNGQICDQGPSYRTAVFVADEAERTEAEGVKAKVARLLGKPVATKVATRSTFWMAEAYHQDYARRNPLNYQGYRIGCGRDAALKAVWRGR